jgi:hypothetical protein
MARVMDLAQYDALKAQGLADREIARRWEIPWGTFHREKQKRQGPPSTVHPTPDDRIPTTSRLILVPPSLRPFNPCLPAWRPWREDWLRVPLTSDPPPSMVVASTVHRHTLTRPPSTRPPWTLRPGSYGRLNIRSGGPSMFPAPCGKRSSGAPKPARKTPASLCRKRSSSG